MIWQPEFTDKILSRKPGAVQHYNHGHGPDGLTKDELESYEVLEWAIWILNIHLYQQI